MKVDKLLWVYCCDCGHERDVNPAMVPLPAETPVPEVGKHMKCSVCGSRKINTKPELYPGGVQRCAVGGHDIIRAQCKVKRAFPKLDGPPNG